MSDLVIDRLARAAAEKGAVCVGLDTTEHLIPPRVLGASSVPEAIYRYNCAIIDATGSFCACYKLQIACYEAWGRAGLEAYAKTLAEVRARGGLAIADIKRGDIADTAALYARAHFSGDFEADLVTLNPYMGMDSLAPWFLEAQKRNKGAFVLLRTSNKGFADFEGRRTADGRRVYDLVGERLLALAAEKHGERGFGIFGAVVGAEAKDEAGREEARAMRWRYGPLFFLIPGYGTQGGGAADARLLLNADGSGGVVNASRSILGAWSGSGRPAEAVTLEGAAAAAREAARAMRDALRSGLTA